MIRYISENPSRLDTSIGEEIKKHLITGPKGNSELCFPETLNFSRDKCHIPPDSKIEKNISKNGRFAQSTSSQTELSRRNDTITVLSLQLTKKGDKGKVALASSNA